MGGIRKRPTESTIFRPPTKQLSIVRKFSAEKTRKEAEERLGLLPPVHRIANYAPFASFERRDAVIYRTFLAFLVYEAH